MAGRDAGGTGDNPGYCCSVNAQFLVVEELVCYNSRGVEVSEVLVLTCKEGCNCEGRFGESGRGVEEPICAFCIGRNNIYGSARSEPLETKI